jgi:hypothetical protein
MVRRVMTVIALTTVGCGGGGGGLTPPPTPLVSVGGTYTTAVALTENTCGPVEIQALPTTVEHAPGSAAFQLTHGGSYTCSLSGASFTCQPRAFDVNGRAETVTVDGQFRTTGFDATARIAVQPAGCAYAVRWTGTKQGAANVLP